MSGIKTPLTYGDALDLATKAVPDYSLGARDRIAQVLLLVDQASREQARADIASGVYPLPHKHVPCPEPYARCLAEEFEVGHGACHRLFDLGLPTQRLCGEGEFAPVHEQPEPAEEAR